MDRIRVLVVDDSLTVRRYLVDTLAADPQIEVVGEAADGKAAIELCQTLLPDVVTLDMMLPEMSGLAATEYIMAYCPTPILIVSASMNRGEVFKTYDALSAGAVDVLDKSRAADADVRWEQQFVSRVKTVSRIKVITHPRARLFAGSGTMPRGGRGRFSVPEAGGYRCVAIGASTGGPGAVASLLRALPGDFPLPILLVIHIGEPFGVALCDWLDGLSPIRVAIAVDGQPLPGPGEVKVIMAPHHRHLVVRGGRLWLSDAPERHSCRPAVDALFESLAREMGSAVIACLLTGMGRDGAQGLLAIRQAGGMTLAQNEETCVVYGMPKEAIELGAAREVLPLGQIAPALVELTSASRPSGK